MKKLLLLILMGSVASATFAQQSKPLSIHDELRNNEPYNFGTTSSANTFPENTSAVIWSQNFTAPLTGVTTFVGSGAAGGASWHVTSTQPSNLSGQNFPAIASGSGAPFAIINSDSATGGTQNDFLIVKVGTSLASVTGVVVTWQQYFRRFQETHKVEVSNDSTTWTEIYNSSVSIPVNTTISNPTTVKRNITSIAAGQTNVWIRFHYQGAWDWFWAVDDITIQDPPGNDLVLEDYSIGFQDLLGFYGQIPTAQLTDSLSTVGAVYNFGLNTQTTSRMNTQISRGSTVLFNNTTANFTIAGNVRDTVSSTEAFPMEGLTVGDYVVALAIDMDSVDASPEDDTVNMPFSVTDSVYGGIRRNIGRATTLGTASFTGNTDGVILAGLIELANADTITAVRVRLGSTTVAGGIVTVAVRDTNGLANAEYVNAFSFTQLISSDAYTLTAADIAAGFVDIEIPRDLFGTPQDLILQPGAYYVSAELISNNGASHIRIIDDLTYERFVQPYQSIIYLPAPDPSTPARWYTNGSSIGVSAVFGDARRLGLNVNELNKNVSLKLVYPNPAKAEVNVSYQLNKAAEVNIAIRDIAGRVVLQSSEGFQFEGAQKSTLALTGLNAGMYFVELNAGGAIAQQKLIISK